MSLDNTDPLQPILLGPDAGEARWWGDSLVIIKASAETSAGRITVIDNYAVEGAAPPLHVHHNEGEGFYVIDQVGTSGDHFSSIRAYFQTMPAITHASTNSTTIA
jgi:hypothetical protein